MTTYSQLFCWSEHMHIWKTKSFYRNWLNCKSFPLFTSQKYKLVCQWLFSVKITQNVYTCFQIHPVWAHTISYLASCDTNVITIPNKVTFVLIGVATGGGAWPLILISIGKSDSSENVPNCWKILTYSSRACSSIQEC